MKKLLTITNGVHVPATMKTSLVLGLTVALSIAFWTAMTPVANAQEMSPTEMIEAQLPEGKTLSTATKSELLSAVCAAIKKYPNAAPGIVKAAVDARKEWTADIVRTALRCLPGRVECDMVADIVTAATAANPDDASQIMEIALQLYPNCRGVIGQPPDEGEFGAAPPNVLAPPGSIGGGGGFNPQENTVTVCDNGVNVQVPVSQVNEYLSTHPGSRLGACDVTPSTNR